MTVATLSALDRLCPASEAELAAMVAGAAATHRTMRIVGGDSRAGLGQPVVAETELHTGGLNHVVLYEPAALTLVAGAGTPLSQIDAMLAAEGQRLPFEPMDHRALYGTVGEPTLGGMVATNASGPRRIQSGACRDSLIGVRYVDGLGRVVKNGGRVMKNVTGYDLVKLMAGSHGTLGVLTEVAFKLLPLPETTATLVIRHLTDTAAIAALSAALGSPYDVTGAAHANGRTLVRIEGFAGSVAHRSAALATVLRGHGAVDVLNDSAEQARLWSDLRDLRGLASDEGAIWRVSVKPSDGPVLVAALGLVRGVVYDWGGGLVSIATDGVGDAGAAKIQHLVAGLGGHATLLRANDDLRAGVSVFQPEPAMLAALTAGLRARFDPRGIFNPGRMTAPVAKG